MPYPPGSVRVVPRVTAIIQDPEERFLLTWHAQQRHYFLPGGKVKDLAGRDLAQIFTHPASVGRFITRLFTMKRESAREAGVREVWEELIEDGLVTPMRWKKIKKHFTVIDSLNAIKITNPHDGPIERYRPEIDTENVILPCKMKLPPLWENEIRTLWERRDPRSWYATPAEIVNGYTTLAKEISPDVARILTRLGLIPARQRDPQDSENAVTTDDPDDHRNTLGASA